ncbi:MAG: alanine-zipper protein [Methylococcales bacterium]|jgi:predicted component of type VI protein secretion system|nr:alanine-zipper protein [Methylococcales bacterium]
MLKIVSKVSAFLFVVMVAGGCATHQDLADLDKKVEAAVTAAEEANTKLDRMFKHSMMK